jgi:hypothetical protein
VGVVSDVEPDPANLPSWAQGLSIALRASALPPEELPNGPVAKLMFKSGMTREQLIEEAEKAAKERQAKEEAARKARPPQQTVIPTNVPVGQSIDPTRADIEDVVEYSRTLRETAEENRQRVYDQLTAELAE